ncbi:MAG: hypothetical protein ACI8WB_003678 [Phenylobacterium sp.]|jgi:hypothetical protein
MTYDSLIFVLTITANIAYALLFIYHATKKNPNSSLMITSGCLCLAMAFVHSFSAYVDSLAVTGAEYKQMTTHFYSIMVMLNSVTVIAIMLLHRTLKVNYHDVVFYVYRGIFIALLLNMAMYIDLIVMGNREANMLWTVFSYGEHAITVFMFCSVFIARKWSDVFKWLKLGHAVKSA